MNLESLFPPSPGLETTGPAHRGLISTSLSSHFPQQHSAFSVCVC